jgi:hypothetical protein
MQKVDRCKKLQMQKVAVSKDFYYYWHYYHEAVIFFI